MPILPPNPTLADFQTYVRDMEVERGFDEQTVMHKCLLLGEEIGELFKAPRKTNGLKVDVTSQIGAADEELADVLIYLCSIANRLDIDLEAAFRQKEAINHNRQWTKGISGLTVILGISASGRENGITSEAVKAVLEATEQPYEFVSLAGLQINGCRGCTGCAGDNHCVVQDDWLAIGEKMREADAIVFGAPNYYGTINALGHACLERTFCFRHREVFSLAGKLSVVVTVDGGAQNSAVGDFIRKMMQSNLMSVVGSVYAEGYSQCLTCGYGLDCAVGGVVGRYGFLEKIGPEHCPPRFAEQESGVFQAYKVGKTLGSILRARF